MRTIFFIALALLVALLLLMVSFRTHMMVICNDTS